LRGHFEAGKERGKEERENAKRKEAEKTKENSPSPNKFLVTALPAVNQHTCIQNDRR